MDPRESRCTTRKGLGKLIDLAISLVFSGIQELIRQKLAQLVSSFQLGGSTPHSSHMKMENNTVPVPSNSPRNMDSENLMN